MSQVQRYAAFTTDPAGGNPAGAVLDADDLGESDMQRIATEVGYSETAFVLRAGQTGNDLGLRFFSPLAEVAFCGHATIATSVALVASGAQGPLRFATEAGPVTVATTREAGAVQAQLRSVPGHSVPVSPGVLLEALAALGWPIETSTPTTRHTSPSRETTTSSSPPARGSVSPHWTTTSLGSERSASARDGRLFSSSGRRTSPRSTPATRSRSVASSRTRRRGRRLRHSVPTYGRQDACRNHGSSRSCRAWTWAGRAR